MGNKIIALDIGGTSIRCALVEKNKISRLVRCETPKDKKEFLNKILELIQSFDSKEVKGIGVGYPGVIDNGIIRKAPNVPIKNFDLKKYLNKKFNKRIEILNDVNCVALAESKLGCKKKNFFVIALGTGIGGGIIINNELYSGWHHCSELGHIVVKGQDFESLWKKSKKQIYQEFNKPLLIKDLIKVKNEKSKKILENSADYIGQGLSSLITVLNPETVILAGGLKESGPVFLNMIKKSVKKYSFLNKKVPIFWSKLSEPGILGASLLIK